MIYGNGNAQVVCHGFCRFVDGTTNKVWTYEDQLLEYEEGCICPGELENEKTFFNPFSNNFDIPWHKIPFFYQLVYAV